MFLVSDIGGTNTRLALFEDSKPLKPVVEKIYSSSEESELTTIIEKFLSVQKVKVKKASIAIAGPIQDNKCKATNLPWVVDAKEISKKNQIDQVFLLNDLLANAFGIRALKSEELITLNKGNSEQEGNACLISAGTGLGQAGIVWSGGKMHPFASEGGHCDFSPRDETEFQLFEFLKKKYDHVSYERILSGPGMLELFEFLTAIQGEKPSKALQERMKTESNGPKVITQMGLEGDLLCEKILSWFISFYGAEAGNLALKFLSLSGVYIGGGIAPRLSKKMAEGGFMKAFADKGRFKPVLESIPVRLITNDRTALLGAAEYGLMQG